MRCMVVGLKWDDGPAAAAAAVCSASVLLDRSAEVRVCTGTEAIDHTGGSVSQLVSTNAHHFVPVPRNTPRCHARCACVCVPQLTWL